MHSLYNPKPSPLLELKVFYVRVCKCEVNKSTPDHLTLNYVPLNPGTVLEANGRRVSVHSECVASVLRRDWMDKRSEEATFVSTDGICMAGSVRFEVYVKEAMLFSGVLEVADVKWRVTCDPMMLDGCACFLKGERNMAFSRVEVYVAGFSSGAPVILTRSAQIGVRKKNQMKLALDSIPEIENAEPQKEVKDASQLSDYRDFTSERNGGIDYQSIYSRSEYFAGEDGELSWFNAGVKVGVGLGLGIGVGVGLLVRTYRATTKNFKR